MNTQVLTSDAPEIKQYQAKDIVFLGTRMLTAQEAATEIAMQLHGLSGWQGALNNGVYAPAGLSALMKKALRKVNQAAMVEEKYLENGTSAYYPYWK